MKRYLSTRSRCALGLAAMTTFGLLACGSGGGTPDTMLGIDDSFLEEASLDDRGLWASAPFQNARWIPLGPGAEVEVEHGLGRMPTSIQVYISGNGDDRDDEAPRAFSPAAGDVANVLQVSAVSITLKNRTQGQFYVRLVLQ